MLRQVTRGATIFAILSSGCHQTTSWPTDYKKPVSVTKEITIAHPSSTGTLPSDLILGHMDRAPVDPKARASWLSLTELSSERICLDYGSYVTEEPEESNVHLDAMRKSFETTGLYVRTAKDERRLELAGEFNNRVFERHQGTYEEHYTAETGNTVSECKEVLRNSNGGVMGCKKYVKGKERAEYARKVEGTVVTRFGGFRACTRNDGLIGPETTEVFISNQKREDDLNATVYRVTLTGGKPTPGTWGGRGGISGLEPPFGLAASAQAASTPAPATTPGSLEEQIVQHATAKLEIVPFKILEVDGHASFELDADGTLRMGKTSVATYERSGLVRTSKGPAIALDRDGVVWLANPKTKHLDELGRIAGNKLTTKDLTYVYEKGTFTSTRPGQPSTSYVSHFSPTTVPPLLALFVIGTQNPSYFTKKK